MGPLMGPEVIVPPAPLPVAQRASIMKAIYKKPKPAREFEGALQHFDLQKTVYHSKLSATSPTDVICDTTESVYTVQCTPKPNNFCQILKRHFTITGGPNTSSQNRAINKGRRT